MRVCYEESDSLVVKRLFFFGLISFHHYNLSSSRKQERERVSEKHRERCLRVFNFFFLPRQRRRKYQFHAKCRIVASSISQIKYQSQSSIASCKCGHVFEVDFLANPISNLKPLISLPLGLKQGQ